MLWSSQWDWVRVTTSQDKLTKILPFSCKITVCPCCFVEGIFYDIHPSYWNPMKRKPTPRNLQSESIILSVLSMRTCIHSVNACVCRSSVCVCVACVILLYIFEGIYTHTPVHASMHRENYRFALSVSWQTDYVICHKWDCDIFSCKL